MPKYCNCRKPEVGKTRCLKCNCQIIKKENIDDLREEHRKCSDPERLKYLQDKLDFFDFGIQNNN